MTRKRIIPTLPSFQADTDSPETSDRSRSQKKRESTAIQNLGEALSQKPLSILRGMDLPADLMDALIELDTMTSREARRRQVQFIGRIMREVDWQSIAEQLERLDAPHQAQNTAFHHLERLRDALLEQPSSAAALLADLPAFSGSIKEIRHLAENAAAERAAKKAPKSGRALFRLLRELDSRAGEEASDR